MTNQIESKRQGSIYASLPFLHKPTCLAELHLYLHALTAIINGMNINEHDKRSIRCRMLGHEVLFSYCRQVSADLPCRKILDCWFEQFDIDKFINQHYTKQQIQKILQPPAPKLASIVELIQQAQKSNDREKK